MTTQKKNTARKKTTNKKTKKTSNSSVSHLQYEIIILALLAFSLLLFVSVYMNKAGAVGLGIKHVLFGTLGIGAYLLPLFIFFASLFKIFNKDNKWLDKKIYLIMTLILFFTIFAHVLSKSSIHEDIYQVIKQSYSGDKEGSFFYTLAHYYSLSVKYRISGGFIGGFFGDILLLLFDTVGTYIILSLITISIFILLTERSFLKMLAWIMKQIRSGGKKVKDSVTDMKNDLLTECETDNKNVTSGSNFLHRVTLNNEVVKENEGNKVNNDNKDNKDNNKKVSEETIKIINEEYADKGLEKKDDSVQQQDKNSSEPNKQDMYKSLAQQQKQEMTYEFPSVELLKQNPFTGRKGSKQIVLNNAKKLEETLRSFGVKAKVLNVSCGPTVTRYELQPEQGVKVSKIVGLADDIALNLAASGIRIEAPIPGKAAVGIEVPNKEVQAVYLREVVDTEHFKQYPSNVAFSLGKDIAGQVIIADIARMPHLLIAGATGSGKSVCINTLIMSIIYKATPKDVRLIMIDPKVVELNVYNGIPHLLIPVVTDPKKAAGALNWAVQEMAERYKSFASANVRDIKSYNKWAKEKDQEEPLPQIVIIVDELADLMMAAPNDVEDAICRLAQMARAAGLHLIIATQRPSVDVITGLIKANIPSRIAFSVSSGTDSRTILDMNGAEKLLGKGDMLFYPVGMQKPLRVQGAFVSDKEVERIVQFLKESQKAIYNEKIMNQLSSDKKLESNKSDLDDYFKDAMNLVIEKQKASASMIQRTFRVGYNRAARIVDQLHDAGIVGPEEGSKPRKVLLTVEEYEAMKNEAQSGSDEIAAEKQEKIDG